MKSTKDSILEWAASTPKALAYADEFHEVTFEQLHSYSRKIAGILTGRGVAQGDLVCTNLPSYLSWLFTLSLHLLGVTTVSKTSPAPFGEEIKPDWIISERPDTQFSPSQTLIFDEDFLALINSSDEMDVVPGYLNPSDPARLFSTSGTNGALKYTMVSASDLSAMFTEDGSFDFAGDDHVLALFHSSARMSFRHMLNYLALGKPYFGADIRSNQYLEVLNKYPIRTLMGSPLQISDFLTGHEKSGINLPLLKTIITAGSPPSQPLIDRIRKQIDCSIFNVYGSTEAGLISIKDMTIDSTDGAIVNPVVDLQVVDESGKQLPPNTLGHIRYMRSGMVQSYYKNPVATAEFFKDGFFYPGDMGLLDSEGKLVLEGRSNEMINLGGVKISPEQIDQIALAQLGVVDCASFALSAESGIDQLAIVLVTDEDFDLEIFKKVMSKKSPLMPRHFFTRQVIPRNENGKVSRQALSLEHEQGHQNHL